MTNPPSPNPLPTTEGLRAVYDAAIAFRDAEEGTVDLSFKWSALKRALDAAKGVNIAYTPPAKTVATTDAPTTEGATHGWQPIESAPKDGRDVLVYANEVRTVASWGVINSPFGTSKEVGWRCESCPDVDGCPSDGITPTHWQPLPPPPGQT